MADEDGGGVEAGASRALLDVLLPGAPLADTGGWRTDMLRLLLGTALLLVIFGSAHN